MATETPGTGAADSTAETPPPSTPPVTPPAPEGTPKDPPAPATPPAPPPAAAPPKAPEKYEFVVPEATKAYADAGLVQRIEQIARASNWTNEDAQAALEEHLEAVRLQATTWDTETKADPTYGGDHFSETQRLAKKVIDRVRPEGHARRESFLSFLGRGGAGNNIEVVSFFADLGRLMSEDSPAFSRAPGGGVEVNATDFYDHPTSRALDEQTRR